MSTQTISTTNEPTVALNDTPANATSNGSTALRQSIYEFISSANKGLNDAVFKLERMEEERNKWEKNEQTASNNRLYSILTTCYSYYLTMKTDGDKLVREAHMKGLEFYIKQNNYQFSPTTHDMTRVVKAVFGADRRRVSVYSIALRAALVGAVDSYGKPTAVPANDLAKWLVEKGGVEEVRTGCKNKGLSVKDRAEVAKTALNSAVLISIKADPNSIAFSTDDTDRMMVLVATYRPTGELEISAVVKNEAAVRHALAAYYSSDKEGVRTAAYKQSKGPTPKSSVALALSHIPSNSVL